MSDKIPTTGEIVGSLRAAARLFKHFEFANEAAELVLKAEASVTKLTKEKKSLEEEKEVLNRECDELVARSTEAEKAIVVHKEEVRKASEKATQEAGMELRKAKEKAKEIVGASQAKAGKIEEGIRESIASSDQAMADKVKAEGELVAIKRKIQETKVSFMDAFE